MLIYKVTNRTNGKVYVGKYVGDEAIDRFQQHIREAKRGGDRYLCRAIRKYGSGTFDVEVLHRAKTADELSKMETFFIVLYQSHKPENGYNMTLGGEGAVGRIVSERTKQLWSKQRRDKPVTESQLHNLEVGWQYRQSDQGRQATSTIGKEVWQRPERRKKAEEWAQSLYDQALVAYLKDPKLCEVCDTVIMPTPSRSGCFSDMSRRKTCSNACRNRLRAAAYTPDIRSEVTPCKL